MLEARARRPAIEWAGRARLPERDLVTFTELCRGVAIQFEDLRERCAGIRAYGGVAWRRRGHFRDAAHTHRVMVPAAQQRRARRGANRGGMKAGVFQPARRESFGGGCLARTAK